MVWNTRNLTPQIGDRIRIVAPDDDLSFGDYAIGDTAWITATNPNGSISVTWDDAEKNDGTHCRYLYREEFEIIERNPLARSEHPFRVAFRKGFYGGLRDTTAFVFGVVFGALIVAVGSMM